MNYLSAVVLLALFGCFAPGWSQVEPGDFWLKANGLAPWAWLLDHDGDGIPALDEYRAGTDPWASNDLLRVQLDLLPSNTTVVSWDSVLHARYQLLATTNLPSLAWVPVGPPVSGGGLVEEVVVPSPFPREFFAVGGLDPLNSDTDGLSDLEEAFLGTRIDSADTDGDTIPDDVEVCQTFTDPLVPDPLGGTIEGRVALDENRDGNVNGDAGLEGIAVFLDLDFDGRRDTNEPWQVTAADGFYRFSLLPPGTYEVRQELDPGEWQTLPAEVVPELLDTWPDELLNYTHSTNGALPVAYGYAPIDVWPGMQFIVLGSRIEPVDPALLLKPLGNRVDIPPIGSYDSNEHLSLPAGASATVRFDELIYDGPGADFILARPVQGAGAEEHETWVGMTTNDLVQLDASLLAMDDSFLLGINLADHGVAGPIQVIRFVSRTPGLNPGEGGADRGAALAGFQALNFLGAETDARRVVIVGMETVGDQDFGRFLADRPPSLLLQGGQGMARAGDPAQLELIPSDDIGLASVSLTVNGQAVPLGADYTGVFTPAYPGRMLVEGIAVDTAGQSVTQVWSVFVTKADGSFPFDPETLSDTAGSGSTAIRVFTPDSGSVLAGDIDLIGEVTAVGSDPVWTVEYAPIGSVDPNDLNASDPDYVLLGSGTGNRFSEPLAVFPASGLADGIYFVRLSAQPAAGGATVRRGMVYGIGVDEASLRPQIVVTSPVSATNHQPTAGLVLDVCGTITSERPVTEWTIELAPRTEVDVLDLGASGVDWTLLASGAGTFSNVCVAGIDTTRLQNDAYVLRVTAWNDLRLGRTEAVLLEIANPAKPGRHRREFTDVQIELAGFPLEVQRIYDSFASDTSGDFGYGWSLAIADANIGETVPDTGANLFGATPYRQGTRVYINTPDGGREGFSFNAELVTQGFIGSSYRPTFVPDPGNRFGLEVPEGDAAFLNVTGDGTVVLSFIGLPYNPDVFVLTTTEDQRYTYDQRLGFLGAEDAFGNRLDYTEAGFQHSSGPSLAFVRDGLGRITSITVSEGPTWLYDYDANGDLVSMTDPDGNLTTFGYLASPAHFLASLTDPFGRVGQSYEYDVDGRLTAIIDEYGNRTEQQFDPSALTGTTTDGRGFVTQLVYDDRGNILQETDPLGNVSSYEYGNPDFPDLETRITKGGRTQEIEYNEDGLIRKVRYDGASSAAEEVRFDDEGQVIQIDNIGGSREVIGYNEDGQVVEVGSIINNDRVSFTYNEQGQRVIRSSGDGIHTLIYDAGSGQIAGEFYLDDPERRFTYDALGHAVTMTDARNSSVTNQPDSLGISQGISGPGGVDISTAAFNPDGSLTKVDAEGAATTFALDSVGEVTGVTLPDGQSVQAVIDAAGNPVSITVPGGHTTTSRYDAVNREVWRQDAAGAETTMGYDGLDRMNELIDGNGRKRTFRYNSFDQLLEEQWFAADGSLLRTFTYSYRGTHSIFDSVTDGTNVWEFSTLDSIREPNRTRVTYAGQGEYGLLIDWAEGLLGVPERIRMDDPRNTAFEGELRAQYQGERLNELRFYVPDGSGIAEGHHVRFYYEDGGAVERIDRFNVSFTSSKDLPPISRTIRQVDAFGRLAFLRHEDASGQLHFPDAEFVYDRTPVGRIESILQPTQTSSYGYDVMGQLVSAEFSAWPDENFGYDVAGNRTNDTTGADNRLLEDGNHSYLYDLVGNVTRRTHLASGAMTHYAYNHHNRLVQVATQADPAAPMVVRVAYETDYAGRVMSRTVDGDKRWILYDRNQPIAEFRDGEDRVCWMAYYAPDDPNRLLATWDDIDGFRWLLSDHNDNVRGTLDRDGGALAWADYDAWGTLRGAASVGLGEVRFAGRRWIEAAGLYENKVRHYNPGIGRFQQQDPLGYASGDFHLYRYVSNNPVSGTDPEGTLALFEYAKTLDGYKDRIESYTEIGECVAGLILAPAYGLGYSGPIGKADPECIEKATKLGWPKPFGFDATQPGSIDPKGFLVGISDIPL